MLKIKRIIRFGEKMNTFQKLTNALVYVENIFDLGSCEMRTFKYNINRRSFGTENTQTRHFHHGVKCNLLMCYVNNTRSLLN